VSLSNGDTTRLLLALILLLAGAHGCGQLCARLGQPRVAGEIIGGLLLGPTLFGHLLPGWQSAIFHQGPAVGVFLGAVYQLGLFLLMFCSGAALRARVRSRERRTITWVAVAGNLVPFAAGLGFLAVYDPGHLIGAAHNRTALVLVFACAVAVTSIPVISKIMTDLGIIHTAFARIVLSVAVLEDVVLYCVLSIALGLVHPAHQEQFSLPSILALKPSSGLGDLYYVVVSALFFCLPLLLGRAFLQRLARRGGNLIQQSSPLAFQVMFLMSLTALALFVGVAAYFGAFVAGILSGELGDDHASVKAQETIRSFSFAFFIPLYFAVVGLRLNLLDHFDVLFFVVFLGYACVAKSVSVYAGARIAGEPRRQARNLSVALNARGGPAIVLASVAYDAGIINQGFFASLVMLALVTSVVAGSWLEIQRRKGVWAGELVGLPVAARPLPAEVGLGEVALPAR
jgi:Kef-type K+ transport system membrane component KefB